MVKSSRELMQMARSCVENELRRAIEHGTQPSFYRVFYDAYSKGVTDGRDITDEDFCNIQDWHYIETEGEPDNENDRFWVLIRYDGYHDVEKGWYDPERKEWNLDYIAKGGVVIAWHKLPESPD